MVVRCFTLAPVVLALAACTSMSPQAGSGPLESDTASPSAAAAEPVDAASAAVSSALAPGRALPAGAGRDILGRYCTSCHDLNGLWAYQGYYTEARWRAMIGTMVDYGAELDAREVEALTAYLTRHFGPGTR